MPKPTVPLFVFEAPWEPSPVRLELGAKASGLPKGISPELGKFGLYATELLKINDRVTVPAGWVGSGKDAVFLQGSSVDANVHARGAVRLLAALVRGDVNYGTGFSTSTPASRMLGRVHKLGSFGEDLAHGDLGIPVDSVSYDYGPDQSIEPGDSLVLENVMPNTNPYFGVITVKSRARLVLASGAPHFKGLMVEPGGQVIVRFQRNTGADSLSPVTLWIRDGISLKGSVVLRNGRPQGLLWRVGAASVDSNMVYFSPSSIFQGTLVAPKASVIVENTAKVYGNLYAKTIEVHQNNSTLHFVPYTGYPGQVDADHDDLDDTLEMRVGTDPNDPDTDKDGLSDGLEYWGRGIGADGAPLHRFGAVLDLRNGLYPKEMQDTLLNPLRRDFLLRVYTHDTSFGQRLLSLQGEASEVMAQNFGKGENYAEVADSAFQWVGTRRIALHVDAGETRMTNWPFDSVRWGEATVDPYGGERIVPSGGVDSGKGPWSWDTINCEVPDLSPYKYPFCGLDGRISGEEIRRLLERQSRTLSISQSFRDVVRYMFVVNNHVYQDSVGMEVLTGQAYNIGRYALMEEFVPYPAVHMTTLWHEAGHLLGLLDISSLGLNGKPKGIKLAFRPSIMRYLMINWGCELERWDSSAAGVKGSWHDTRWCGDGEKNPIHWDSLVRDGFTVKFPYVRRGLISGELGWDRWGDDWEWHPDNLTYSNGRYCPLDLRSLNERQGRAICFDRNHRLLAEPIPGTPIDWNGNGILDEESVDIWTDTLVRKRWFVGNWAGVDTAEIYDPMKGNDQVPNEWNALDPQTGFSRSVGISCTGLRPNLEVACVE